MPKVSLPVLCCRRRTCRHTWIPKWNPMTDSYANPKVCPKCKHHQWDTESRPYNTQKGAAR